jgi:hypothetical protein
LFNRPIALTKWLERRSAAQRNAVRVIHLRCKSKLTWQDPPIFVQEVRDWWTYLYRAHGDLMARLPVLKYVHVEVRVENLRRRRLDAGEEARLRWCVEDVMGVLRQVKDREIKTWGYLMSDNFVVHVF